MQAVGPAASGHEASGELVDDDHLAVLDDVVLVALEQDVRLEALLDAVLDFVVGEVVDVVDAQRVLDLCLSLLG